MSGETGPKAKSPPCLGCKAKITTRQTCVMCHVCQRWTHPDCSGIPSELVKYLVKTEKQGQAASWSCDGCKLAAEALSTKIAVLNKDVEEMKKDMKTMRDNQNDLKKRVEVLEESNERKDEEEAQVRDDVQQSVFSEIREREEKKMNFIVHGIPDTSEDTNLTGYDKKDIDTFWLASLLADMKANFDVETDVKYIRRLGEIKEDACRPILVGCRTEEKKKEVFKNCRNLGNQEHWYGVNIVPDLTKQQRREEAEKVSNNFVQMPHVALILCIMFTCNKK